MPQVPPATLAQVPLVAAPPPGGAAPRKHRERVDSQRPSAKFIDTKARSQSETFPSRLPPAPAKVINEILDPVWRNWGLVKTPNAGAKWARGSETDRKSTRMNSSH